MPHLETVLGGHLYLHLISKIVDHETERFDLVAAVLPQLRPLKPVAEDEHDGELEHNDDYEASSSIR